MASIGMLLYSFFETPSRQAVIEIVHKATWWEIACAIGTLSVLVIAVYFTVRFNKIMLRMSRYTYLANKWYEIKDKEFQAPSFADKSKTDSYNSAFKEDMLRKYEAFAWMCWGHAEDVFRNNWHNEPDFSPTIKYYKKLHYKWLVDQKGKAIFTPKFIDYIDTLQ